MTHPVSPWRIAILGGREASNAGKHFARNLGRLLAERGALVYCGGGGGIMAAACEGVAERGGLAIGILKGPDVSEANPYVTIPIATGMGDLRNGIIIRSVQAAVAIEGAFGTLSEIAYSRSGNVPILGYHTWDIEGVIKVERPEETIQKLEEILK